MKGKAVGFYLTLIAAILSIVACVLYKTVMYRMGIVYVFCIAAVVLAAVVIALSAKGGFSKAADFLPVVNAILMASAAVWGANLMVNEIGYVIAALDSFDAIQTFVIFEVVACISLILNLVSSFMKQSK
jgi:hypothetical protein